MTRLSADELARVLRNPDVTLVTDETGYTTVEPRRDVDNADVQPTRQVGAAYRLTLDYPPSANRYWRMVNNRMLRSREAKNYIAYVGQLCATAGIKPLDGDVRVVLRVYRPQRSGDLDNRIKVALDSLQGFAYHNDEQIAEIDAKRRDDRLCPRVEIEISRVGGVNNGQNVL